jgi:hypothetical protein
VTVAVLARQDVAARGKRFEERLVKQVRTGKLLEPRVARKFGRLEEIFREDVRFIVRRLLGTVRSAVVDVIRDEPEGGVDDPRQEDARLVDARERGGVEQADFIFVEKVARPGSRCLGARVRIAVGCETRCIPLN